MRHMITLLTGLLLTACTNPSTQTKLENASNNTKIDHIAGNYKLNRGIYAYKDGGISINKNITHANLVIERLDNDDFGFYYTVQVEKLVPDSYFGIFHYENNKFYQKIVEEPSLTTTLLDNMELITDKDRLKLTVNTTHGKRVIIWNKNLEANITKTPELTKALKDAKQNYIEIYKEKFATLIEV